jgi:hypothetical protein
LDEELELPEKVAEFELEELKVLDDEAAPVLPDIDESCGRNGLATGNPGREEDNNDVPRARRGRFASAPPWL